MALHTNGVPIPVALKCSKCGAMRPTEQFPRHKTVLYGRDTSMCKACKRRDNDARRSDPGVRAAEASQRRERYAENPDAERERKAKYYAENAAAVRERMAKYHADNTARHTNRVQDPNVMKACAKCGEILPETSFSLNRARADGLQSKCKDCAHGAYRKACLALHGAPEHTTCHLCGLPNTADAWADHLVPQSLGGSDEGSNLHWACARCNTARGNRPLTLAQIARLPRTCTYQGELT